MNAIEICPGVIHLEESYRVYCPLVQGAALSVLADTGLGKTNLRPYAEAKISAPYIVVNTHGHADHVGGNRFFDCAFLAEADWPLAGPDAGRLSALVPGTVFDLGDDSARIVSLAGHTLGSCGILLERRRLLLADDIEINRQIAARFLTHLGFDVDMAADGEEAVSIVANRNA